MGIKVTVQTEDRLEAINNLSIAIREVAKALSDGTHVQIEGCTFKGSGILVDTQEDVTETMIKEK